MYTPEIVPTKKDADLLHRSLRHRLVNENFELHRYLDNLIRKPWGHEYRIYIDNIYDLWKLTINAGCQTSMHCHPRKDTALVCLSGTGLFGTVDQEWTIRQGDYLVIRKGSFHLTKNIGQDDLELVEVETPPNKLDLVRSSDANDRANAYETYADPLPAMECVGEEEAALYRPGDIAGKYSFVIEQDQEYVRNPTRLFSVSIGMENYFRSVIEIIRGGDLLGYASTKNRSFLSIYSNSI